MRKIVMSALIAATALLGACEEWREIQSKDFGRLTPEQQDPAAYRQYLEQIRNYKQQKHHVTMITIPGSVTTPSRQNQHLTAMADSVDYICMTHVAGMHPDYAKEIAQIFAAKGTRTLCVVDYMSIEEAWKLQLEENGGSVGNIGEAELADYTAYCREQTTQQLSDCDRYGFAGIEISYLGRTSTPLEEIGQQVFMSCIGVWRTAHPKALMFFRGYTQNLKQTAILSDCDYIVILCGTASSASQLTLEIRRKITEGVPVDRFVMEVAIPSLADPTQVGATAPVAAAWVTEPDERFVKLGLALANAQDDYYNIDLIYKNTRQAIAIMNPASNN